MEDERRIQYNFDEEVARQEAEMNLLRMKSRTRVYRDIGKN
ncbi:unnamed protein product [Linum tenue]|uniref:Uncharacterized protein n=1 Tax=Linum tenue TaxID=586396 RepID=A0AAV0HRD7_9ROSI|nr:unnamed protein product [Linum tenue]